MAGLERERAAKLALLEALAASQRAVARMLESTADLSARFPGERPENAAAMLARLAGLQLRMCESLLGVKLRRVAHGRPAAPWLASERLRAGSESIEPAAGAGCVEPTGGGGCGDRTSGKRRRATADYRLAYGREPE